MVCKLQSRTKELTIFRICHGVLNLLMVEIDWELSEYPAICLLQADQGLVCWGSYRNLLFGIRRVKERIEGTQLLNCSFKKTFDFKFGQPLIKLHGRKRPWGCLVFLLNL